MAHTILPLTEQIVLVTGGARGLRAAITRAFLAQGARVVIDYHTSQDAAEDLAAAHPGKAIVIRADVRDRAQVDALVAEAADRFGGPITTVVNNALADFSFNGDARSHADQISYEEITAQFTGSGMGLSTSSRPPFPAWSRRASAGSSTSVRTSSSTPPCPTTTTPRRKQRCCP